MQGVLQPHLFKFWLSVWRKSHGNDAKLVIFLVVLVASPLQHLLHVDFLHVSQNQTVFMTELPNVLKAYVAM